jgi:glycosyltransferase involved in cell wall biosynthesis
MQSKKGFSIIICTRNRYDLLQEALRSLISQIKNREDVELIIVDNDSIDQTSSIVSNYPEFDLSNVFLVTEKKIGLSFARNKGAEKANFDWVCYMDDDAKAYDDFVEVMFSTRDENSFDVFGGMFYPWYYLPQPKWLPKEVGVMHQYSKEIIILNNGQFVAGGICAFNKKILFDAGGFPTHIGMRGDVVGYGEENFLQIKIRELGGTIGFNPKWCMYHLVAPYKYSLYWNLNRFYSKGRDSNSYLPAIASVDKIKIGLRVLFLPPFKLIQNFPNLVINKNYLWQNWILDSFKYSLRMFGRLKSKK